MTAFIAIPNCHRLHVSSIIYSMPDPVFGAFTCIISFIQYTFIARFCVPGIVLSKECSIKNKMDKNFPLLRAYILVGKILFNCHNKEKR